MENNIENNEARLDLFKRIFVTFFNASRGHEMSVYDYSNPVERLSGLALFLYLIKNNNLSKAINIQDSQKVVAFLVSTSDDVDKHLWLKNDIQSMGLLLNEKEIDSSIIDIVEKNRKALRNCTSQDNLIRAFDYIIEADLKDHEFNDLLECAEEYLVGKGGKSSGVYTNPTSLSKLVAQLLGDNVKTVFDPFMGLATFASYLPPKVNFVGYDIQQACVDYAKLKMTILGRKHQCISQDSTILSTKAKYDAIATFPPMGVQCADKKDIVEYAFKMFDEKTTEKGELVIVVNNALCSSSKFIALRKKYTDLNFIDKIIAIPGGYLYNTGKPVTILHLKKYRNQNEDIEVFNYGEVATEVGRRIEINPTSYKMYEDDHIDDLPISWIKSQDIIDNDYDWSAISYPCTNSSLCFRGEVSTPFTDLVEKVIEQPCKSTLHKDEVLDIRRVESPFDPIQERTLSVGKYVKITEPVLVVGYKADCLLCAVDASDELPVYLSEQEIIYRCSDKVLPQYLAYIFSKTYHEQKYFETGSTLLGINQSINKWLSRQMVGLISIPEQKVIVEDAEHAYVKHKAEKLNLNEYVDRLKEQYAQEVRSRKHNMRPYLRELKSSNDLAQLILRDATSLDDVREKLLPILHKMEINRKGLSEIVDHLSQIDKYGEAEVVNLLDALTERIQCYRTQTNIDFAFKFVRATDSPYTTWEVDPKDSQWGLYVEISHYDLKRMIDCIVENARVHGFEGKDEGHHISIEVEPDYDEYQITITNDGLPLPEGFDINRYGLLGEKAGKYGGTGDGGHQVVSIAKHFGGYVTLESTSPSDPVSRVSVIIHLPIFDKDGYDQYVQEHEEFVQEFIEKYNE